MTNYTVAIHTRSIHFDKIINTLQQHGIQHHTYMNMRVLMDEHNFEQGILVKNWQDLPERKQTEIRLLAYTVDTVDITDDELLNGKQKPTSTTTVIL